MTTAGRAFWVRWSPEGARLRFTVIGRERHTRSLWEVAAEGHDLRPVPLQRREGDLDCCGDWSADGRQFFFMRHRDERTDIWAIRERRRLVDWTPAEPVPLTRPHTRRPLEDLRHPGAKAANHYPCTGASVLNRIQTGLQTGNR